MLCAAAYFTLALPVLLLTILRAFHYFFADASFDFTHLSTPPYFHACLMPERHCLAFRCYGCRRHFDAISSPYSCFDISPFAPTPHYQIIRRHIYVQPRMLSCFCRLMPPPFRLHCLRAAFRHHERDFTPQRDDIF